MLFNEMEKKMKHVKAYKTDFEIDKKVLLAANPGEEFIWLTRPCGTVIVPAKLAKLKGAGANDTIHYYLGEEGLRAYRVKITEIKDGEAFGTVTSDKKLAEWMKENEFVPATVTAELISYDGRKRTITISYEVNLFEAFLEALEWRKGEVETYKIIDFE